jgi:hypothetical protein
MGENVAQARRGRGRPARYLDGADRQAAFRERRADEAALGEAARALIGKPTPAFVKLVIDRLLDQATDREAVRVELAAYLAKAWAAPTA